MIHIITNSTACLPQELASRYQIPVIPQIVNFNHNSFYEGVNLDNPTFMNMLKSSRETPKTAAPPPELFNEHFARMSSPGRHYLLHPSICGSLRHSPLGQCG